jgi:hypothetical protein
MAGGAKPGERRGGRQKGVPNKVTAELRESAQQYTDEALSTLAGIMRSSKNDQARAAAANSILDRGWGKPHQTSDVAVNRNRDLREWTTEELTALLNEETGGPPSASANNSSDDELAAIVASGAQH